MQIASKSQNRSLSSQNMVAQNMKKGKKLKRYDRRENTVCTLFARREQAAATTCATYKHHGRYKDAVETSCGQCRRCEDIVF